MRAAPFIAIPEKKPRRMRSIRTGPRPVLMTWPPMPQRTGLRARFAEWMAESRARRSFAARKLGSESRNFLREELVAGGLAKSDTVTLLLREASGYVSIWPNWSGKME